MYVFVEGYECLEKLSSKQHKKLGFGRYRFKEEIEFLYGVGQTLPKLALKPCSFYTHPKFLLDDCVRAVLAAKIANPYLVLKKFLDCVGEIDEAGEAISDTIDKWEQEATAQIMRKSSEDLINRLNDIKRKAETSKAKFEERKQLFFNMCNVVKSQ